MTAVAQTGTTRSSKQLSPLADTGDGQSTLVALMVSYLLMFLSAGLLLTLMMFNDTRLALPLQLIFLAILLLSLQRWTAPLLLALIQLDLLLREPRRYAPGDGLSALIFVLLVLSLLMFCSRYHCIRRLVSLSFVDWVRALFSRDTASSPRPRQYMGERLSHILPLILSLVIFGISILALCGAGARILLELIPSRRDPEDWQFIDEAGDLILWPGPLSLVILAAIFVVVSELTWRQISPLQARMYGRTLFANLLYTDLRMIVRRRLRLRRQKQQAQRATRAAADNSVSNEQGKQF